MKAEVKKAGKKDKLFFLIIFPLILVSTVFILLLAEKISENNGRVCNYLGKIWLNGSPTDPGVRKGCYTYEQIAEFELEELK